MHKGSGTTCNYTIVLTPCAFKIIFKTQVEHKRDRNFLSLLLFINVFFAVADHDSLVGVAGALATKTVGRTTLAVI